MNLSSSEGIEIGLMKNNNSIFYPCVTFLIVILSPMMTKSTLALAQTRELSNLSSSVEASNLSNVSPFFALFEQLYFSPSISPRHCGQNISQFISLIKAHGLDLRVVTAVQITAPWHRWSFGRLVATQSRWRKSADEANEVHPETWDFHIVALIQGLIYDFSFGPAPRVLPIADYLNEMFIPKQPFMLYGPTYRVGNDGPWYTAEHSHKELTQAQFKLYQIDPQEQWHEVVPPLDLRQFLNL